MTHGSHVLCEKPVAGTLADARRMATTARNTGRFLAIGYQWSFSSAIQNLKMDILAGVYGKPRRLKTVVLWPRNRSYYQRNSWAGAIRTQDGTVVLDSPVNNATAHYLHNMLFLLGGEPGSAALPTTVEAELYRANPIANYDAAALRVHTAGGAELLMLTAHTSPVSIGPLFEYEFENGVVRFPDPRGGIRGQRTDGTLTNYGDPEAEGNMIKLWQCVEAAQSGGRPACDIEAATAHLLCVLGAQQSQPVISAVPSSFVVQEEREDNDILTWIRGLPELFLHAFAAGRLPNELGLAEWTIPPARTIQFDEIADLS